MATDRLYIHGAVFPEDPGQVYLRAEDVIDGMRRSLDELRAQMDAVPEDRLLEQDECLRFAAMIGAVEVLEQHADSLDIVCLEFTNDVEVLPGVEDGS